MSRRGILVKTVVLSIMLCALFIGESYAQEWKEDEGGKWYLLDDGTYPRSGFYKVGETWYYFDENGYMDTGWVQSSTGFWYYMDESTGALLRSTTTPDGYYVDENGKWDRNGSMTTSEMYSQDVVELTKDKAKEIVNKAISTSKELLSVNSKLKYCSTVDEYVKEIKASDSKIQMVSLDSNELMSMMEPYVELNEALSLLSQAKDSLPENAENVNSSTVNSWFNSLKDSVGYYRDFLVELNNCTEDMLE